MSTLAYAAFTTKREESPVGASFSKTPPGIGAVVDAAAALVPAEVLALHAVIISLTTTTDNTTTTVLDKSTLFWAFYFLIFASILLYVGPRLKAWGRWDFARAAIPPIAFVGWTMLQRATAFDAVCGLGPIPRAVIAVCLVFLVGYAAVALAYKADRTIH